MTNEAQERRIFADIERCELGLALTKGALKRRYAKHRKACLAEIARMNKNDGYSEMTDDELLAALAS